jgi:predicted DNA-binding antitoxin AbrB/MazE fold protein
MTIQDQESLMERVEAVFEGGAFRPLTAVHFVEGQRVHLIVEAVHPRDAETWFERAAERHRQTLERRGPFPDSTVDIREDRERET